MSVIVAARNLGQYFVVEIAGTETVADVLEMIAQNYGVRGVWATDDPGTCSAGSTCVTDIAAVNGSRVIDMLIQNPLELVEVNRLAGYLQTRKPCVAPDPVNTDAPSANTEKSNVPEADAGLLEKIQELMQMGHSESAAKVGLRATNNNVKEACEYLMKKQRPQPSASDQDQQIQTQLDAMTRGERAAINRLRKASKMELGDVLEAFMAAGKAEFLARRILGV